MRAVRRFASLTMPGSLVSGRTASAGASTCSCSAWAKVCECLISASSKVHGMSIPRWLAFDEFHLPRPLMDLVNGALVPVLPALAFGLHGHVSVVALGWRWSSIAELLQDGEAASVRDRNVGVSASDECSTKTLRFGGAGANGVPSSKFECTCYMIAACGRRKCQDEPNLALSNSFRSLARNLDFFHPRPPPSSPRLFTHIHQP